ncbi:hypothetical protein EMCRGX_G012710 [Ephydatia muelleri]
MCKVIKSVVSVVRTYGTAKRLLVQHRNAWIHIFHSDALVDTVAVMQKNENTKLEFFLESPRDQNDFILRNLRKPLLEVNASYMHAVGSELLFGASISKWHGIFCTEALLDLNMMYHGIMETVVMFCNIENKEIVCNDIIFYDALLQRSGSIEQLCDSLDELGLLTAINHYPEAFLPLFTHFRVEYEQVLGCIYVESDCDAEKGNVVAKLSDHAMRMVPKIQFETSGPLIATVHFSDVGHLDLTHLAWPLQEGARDTNVPNVQFETPGTLLATVHFSDVGHLDLTHLTWPLQEGARDTNVPNIQFEISGPLLALVHFGHYDLTQLAWPLQEGARDTNFETSGPLLALVHFGHYDLTQLAWPLQEGARDTNDTITTTLETTFDAFNERTIGLPHAIYELASDQSTSVASDVLLVQNVPEVHSI